MHFSQKIRICLLQRVNRMIDRYQQFQPALHNVMEKLRKLRYYANYGAFRGNIPEISSGLPVFSP